MKKIIAAFIFFAFYLSLLQFTTPHIIGFDGYSHTKIAEIIGQSGFFQAFPWLPFTSIGTNYANIQVLYHALLIPFTSGSGPKIAAVLFSSLFFTVFYWFLRTHKVRYSFLYTVILLTGSAELTYRFLLTRPFVLGLLGFILTLYFLQKKMRKSLLVLFFVYSLTYSGFIFGLAAATIAFIINAIKKKSDYKLIIAPFLGAVAGLILNPYFPQNIPFLLTQWFSVNLAGNFFNQEWRAWPILDLIKFAWVFILLFIISAIQMIRTKKYNQYNLYPLILTALFFIALLTSRRFLEYFAPLAVILFAVTFKNLITGRVKHLAIFLVVALTLTNFLAVREDVRNNDFLHRLDGCTDWLGSNAPSNSLIFNNAYTFNYLFYKNPQFRYTHGLDLTYSYLHDEPTFNRYMNALQGQPVQGNIVTDLGADFVLIGKIEQDIQLFNYLNQHNDDFELVYDDLDCTILEVKK